MGFQDNSGDLILDVVLTDEGRRRLARGDNSFRVAKFALADDEINYELYNKNHASGSAYFDLEIMQTPVLEALTSDLSTPSNFLVTYGRQDLLFLPVLKLNQNQGDTKYHSKGTFVVAVDEATEELIYAAGAGVVKGENGGGSFVRIDQGLDTEDISYNTSLREFDNEMVESMYDVHVDSRFARIVSSNFEELAPVSDINSEKMATYKLDVSLNPEFVQENKNTKEAFGTTQVIKGPRGTILSFSLSAAPELRTGTSYFTELGTTEAASAYKAGASGNVQYIDSSIRIVGDNTRFNLDIPVRFVKKVA